MRNKWKRFQINDYMIFCQDPREEFFKKNEPRGAVGAVGAVGALGAVGAVGA
jgi:hypothetical protein